MLSNKQISAEALIRGQTQLALKAVFAQEVLLLLWGWIGKTQESALLEHPVLRVLVFDEAFFLLNSLVEGEV